MRAVTYARYSTDLQSGRSIEDQQHEIARLAERHGWAVVQQFSDKAISGSSFDQRPGIQELLLRVQRGDIDVVVAEALDRISRDQEHSARIFKRLSFGDVKLWTISEGEITELHVGLGAAMSATFLRQLREKTRRGLAGRVRDGFCAGGKVYGYRLVRTDKGTRYEIDKQRARVVQDIFKMYIAGKSPRQIAEALNARKVPSPRGTAWSASAIYGNVDRQTGLLANQLYIGKLIWGRRRWRKDPQTERRVPVLNDPASVVEIDMPELRIIDDRLWAGAQARMAEIASKTGAVREALKRARARGGRYHKWVLSGILRCATCGSGYTSVNRDEYGCATHTNRGPSACSNKIRIRRDVADAAVLAAIRDDLFTAEGLAKVETVIRQRLLARTREFSGEQRQAKRDLERVEAEIANMLAAIRKGILTASTKADLERLEREKARHEAALKVERIDFADIKRWLPDAVAEYRKALTSLETEGMSRETSRARQAISELTGGQIDVKPQPDGSTNLVLRGDFSALIRLATKGRKKRGTNFSESRVAGARSHLYRTAVQWP